MNKYIISLFAFIDSSSFIMYITGVPEVGFYGATLGAKLILLIFYRRSAATDLLYAQGVLYFIIVGGVVNSIIQSEWNSTDMQAFGFVAHMICTCWVVDYSNYRRYFSSCANAILACSLLFLAMFLAGHIEVDLNGRHTFFGAHPNLGGEIFAAGVFASLIGQDAKRNNVQVVILGAAVMVLESRAALITILLMYFLKFLDVINYRRGMLQTIAIGTAVCVVVAVAAYSVDWSSLLLIDDPYRGVGTGVAGRSERWEFGWNAFLSAPVFGNGYAFYYDQDVPGAHNFFIYLLALFGMFGVLLLMMYIFLGYILYKNNPRVARVVIGFALLCIFNDRLFDLNPYPFFLHVILLTVPRFGAYLGTREDPRMQAAKY